MRQSILSGLPVFSLSNCVTLLIVCATFSLYVSSNRVNFGPFGKAEPPQQCTDSAEEVEDDHPAPLWDCLVGDALIGKVPFVLSKQDSPGTVGRSLGGAIRRSEAWLSRGPPV